MDYNRNKEYISVPHDTIVNVDSASNTGKTASRALSRPQPILDGFQWKFLLSWRFLHPFAWFMLFCVAGPLMVYLLNDKINSGHVDYRDYGIRFSANVPVACDVQPPWTSWSTLFQIDIRTGNISFTKAKIGDVAFDLIVGRVGQATLAWVSYRVYTDVFISLAERQPVLYETFFAVTTQPISLSSLWSYIAAIFSRKEAKITLLWTLVTASYCLAYPTLVSASTSLVGATKSAISLDNGGTASVVDYVRSAAYKLTNSGLTDDPWFVYIRDIHAIPFKAENIMNIGNNSYSRDDDDKIKVNSTIYTISNDTTIDAGFYYKGDFYQADTTKDTRDDSLWSDRQICMPDEKNYQWGASYELICIIVICQILWSTAMLVVWTYACGISPTLLSGRKMGLYTAMLLLAEPLKKELSEKDDSQELSPGGHLHSEKRLRRIAKTMEPVMYKNSILE